MLKRLHIFITLFFLLTSSSLNILYAQNQKNTSIKLIDVLKSLEEKYQINFSYNYNSLSTIEIQNNLNCTTLKACLTQLKKTTTLNFELSGDNNYIIIPEKKNIKFKVIDAETKNEIPSLDIRVNKDPTKYLLPKNGFFELEKIAISDSVHIRSDFHKRIHLIAADLQNLKQPLELGIEQIQLNEVVISNYITSGINTKLSEHEFQIKTESLKTLAGETDGDIFKIIKNIPGIQTPSSKPGSLVVRGSVFDHTLLQIDDIPIYHNGHFFGAFSPYNPNLIESIDVQRNALSAKYGGRVGGLINMNTNNKVVDSASYNIMANSFYTGASAKIPLLKNKLGLFVGGRLSYPHISSPKLRAFSTLNFQGSRLESVAEAINKSDENFETLFYDMNAKLVYDVNTNNKISISFINIQNRLDAQLSETTENGTNKDFRDASLNNWGITSKWTTQFSTKFSGEFRFTTSIFDIINESEGFEQDVRSSFEAYENTINDTRFISEFNYELNSKTNFEAGYTLTNHKLTNKEQIELSDIFEENEKNGMVHSIFVLSKNNWSKNLTTNIGLHTDYYQPTQQVFVDPRFNLTYKFNQNYFLKASAGRAHQFIQKKYNEDFDDFNLENQFWFLADNEDTSVLESYQTMLGGFYKKSGWLIDVELYFKDTQEITKQFISGETDLKGNTISVGMDFFMRKKWSRFESWFSYSLSKINTDFNGIELAFFDQRHIVNFTNLLYLNKWEFALSWSYLTGMPVVLPSSFNGASNEIPYSNRFPAQHQLDVSTTYTFLNKAKNVESVIGLSFVNIYSQENIINIFQNSSEIAYRKAIGFAPNLQVSLKF